MHQTLMKDFDFSPSRVLVVGDVMLDSYLHGSTSRISPEAPVPVVKVDHEEARVGGAGNVALNAAALGASCMLLGLVGQDAAADRLETLLSDRGVHCNLQRVAGSRTITKQRILSRHQQLIRLDFEDHFPNWDAGSLERDFVRLLDRCNVVVLSDYAKGMLRQSQTLIATANERGLPVVVDPKGNDFERYRGATLITPNLVEFEAVVGHCASEREIIDRGTALRDHLGLTALLITRSEKGMTLLVRGSPALQLPTRAQEVFDVTGAGDTVVATLASALGAGTPMIDAVTLANAAAGVVVAKLGTATVSPQELRAAIDTPRTIVRLGALGEEEVLLQLKLTRGRGETVVMTNGCFDMLHPGHIDYLEHARSLGDRLVVAINSDDSVRRLKGPTRPINPLESRTRMLAALSCVDWVVAFDEDTPERLICRALPDLLVKGGDYTEDLIAGAACVKAAGGSVQVLRFLPGHSTTGLIQKIQGSAT